jgi:hypothetical protein
VYRLNQQDGSQVIGQNGEPKRAYTNDDIAEYARMWTGFVEQYNRGNIEQGASSNQVDPMIINMLEYRDVFPKMGLNRRYIGDRYPLCADLQVDHFHKDGAKYLLLGKNPRPDLLEDPVEWDEEITAQRFILQPNGGNSIFAKLRNSQNPAGCQYDARLCWTKLFSVAARNAPLTRSGGWSKLVGCTMDIFARRTFTKHSSRMPEWLSRDLISLKCADPRTRKLNQRLIAAP